MAKFIENEPNSHNIITSGTEITGDISSNGDIRLDGVLNGNVITKGKLVIGESGKIKGTINCKNADIYGFVEGKVNISELLSLKSTSTITGEIVTNRLAIEPGCKFSGNCKMTEDKSTNGNGNGKHEINETAEK